MKISDLAENYNKKGKFVQSILVKRLFFDNIYFYLLFLLFVGAGAYLISSSDHLKLHLYFNSYVGNPYIDSLFNVLTYVGDGIFTLFVVEVLLFINVKNALFILFSYAISGGITQLLKYKFFDEVNRPFFYYSYEGLKLNIVKGVEMHIHNSFPSGHSTAAFSLLLCIALLVKNIPVKITCFFIALAVAFSRVYLSQHFFEDIYAGSIIAVIVVSLLFYILYYSGFSGKVEKFNRPILALFKNEKHQDHL